MALKILGSQGPNGNAKAFAPTFAPKEQISVETTSPEEEALLKRAHVDLYARAVSALEDNLKGKVGAVITFLEEVKTEVDDPYVAGAVKNIFSCGGRPYLEMVSFLMEGAVSAPEATTGYLSILISVADQEEFIDLDELWKENKVHLGGEQKEKIMKKENKKEKIMKTEELKERFEKVSKVSDDIIDTLTNKLTNKKEEDGTSIFQNPWVIGACIAGIVTVGIGAYAYCIDNDNDIVILD